MMIDYCEFPDNLLYDYDGNTWANIRVDELEAEVGITSLLSGITGKLSSLRPKPLGTRVSRGVSLGTLESARMVGPIPSPLTGVITATNDLASSNPQLINDSPYSQGWIVRLRPEKLRVEQMELLAISKIAPLLKHKISEFHVRCFKVSPDSEMVEVGVECGAVLARLNEWAATAPVGGSVHVVSDDPTAYVEMVAWSDRTGQELVEWRKEGELYHFIIRKRQV